MGYRVEVEAERVKAVEVEKIVVRAAKREESVSDATMESAGHDFKNCRLYGCLLCTERKKSKSGKELRT